MGKRLGLALVYALAACGSGDGTDSSANGAGNVAESPNKVETTGKRPVPIAQVPADVLAAAAAARAGFTPKEAESETRDGRDYFDIGGTLADGSEIEFDIMNEGGRWRVVESQRDIAFAAVPAGVRDAVKAADATFAPGRVIESTQQDGVVIYELYGPAGGDPQGRKVEVKWDGGKAEILTREWAH